MNATLQDAGPPLPTSGLCVFTRFYMHIYMRVCIQFGAYVVAVVLGIADDLSIAAYLQNTYPDACPGHGYATFFVWQTYKLLVSTQCNDCNGHRLPR